MKGQLSLKQKKFLKRYLETGNLARSAKYAGSKGNGIKSLSAIGGQILDSLGMTFQEKLNAFGLTDELLMKKLMEGLDTHKMEIATYRGKICDEKAYPDRVTRAKYLEMLARMKALFVDRHELSGKDGGDIILTVVPSGKRKKSHDIDLD